ncbi:MAG TPA: EamA family transporter [Burkholderiales bacterium]|jgi:drug/metabolite transporter (DMT)-like permease|nr:EamA family transporter [Burkholderiales bacterium]
MELTPGVTLAVLGAALLHAGWNALVKGSEDKQLDTLAVAASSGVLAAALAPFLPAPAPASWPWLAGSTAVHILYFGFLAGAYRWGELSYVYPVMRGGGPMIVAASGALAFAEILDPSEWLGVALISIGIVALASGAHDRRATAFALANAVVIGAYTLIDAAGARASAAPVSYTLWFFVANGVVITGMGLALRGRAVPAYFRRHWLRAAVGGACALGAYCIALWAMTRAPVALVAVLRETSVLFAAVLGAAVLKEKITRRRLVATGAVLAGLAALKL